MTVGNACTPTGATCLNLETCNRDKESAKIFLTPGTWRARNKMLNFKHASTKNGDIQLFPVVWPCTETPFITKYCAVA